MNLQELLNYRSQCLIHEKRLKPRCYKDSLRNDKIKVGDGGLSLCSRHYQDTYDNPSLTGLNFRFNGQFDKNDACPKWVIDDTLIVYMSCDLCAEQPILKERDPGASTLMNLKQNSYYYSFALQGLEDGTYQAGLGWESVKYTRDNKFYHVDVDLLNNDARCRMGSCDMSFSLDFMLKGLLTLKVPNFNLNNMRSMDQLTTKMNLYNLFS